MVVVPLPLLLLFIGGSQGASIAADPDLPPLSGVVLHPFEPPTPPLEAGSPGAGPPVLVNTGSPNPSAAQNEPFLAVDPNDCFRIVASFNDYSTGDVRSGFSRSQDGGINWTGGLLLEPTHMAQGNSSVGADRDGGFYLAMLSFNRNLATGQVEAGIGSGIYVGFSPDGGATWAGPYLIGPDTPTSFEDKPLLVVDTTGGPYDGIAHTAWARFLDTDGVPATFEQSRIWYRPVLAGVPGLPPPVQISDPSGPSGGGPCPAVGPAGQVYCAWKSGNNFYLDQSSDGGLTWGADLPIFPIVQLPNPLYPGFAAISYPTLLADAGSGLYSGRLYVVWADYGAGDADVLCRRSTNGGLAWSAPVRVNDDPIANGRDQFLPWAVVGPDGTLHVMFLDRRDDPANHDFRPYYARSTDGGYSFGANLPLTAASSSPLPNFSGTFLGDYNGIAAAGHGAFPAWVDTGGGSQDVFAAGVHGGSGYLHPDAAALSTAAGGTLRLCLSGGPANAGRFYSLLATASGTVPGIVFSGVPIPINPDPITLACLSNPDSALFLDFHEPLNAFGNGSASLNLAPGLATVLVGMPLSLAYILLNPLDLVSEVTTIDLGP